MFSHIIPGFLAYVGPLLTAMETGEVTFAIAGYTVDINYAEGQPNHLTFGEVILLAEKLVEGVTGSIQIGDVSITVEGKHIATPGTSANAQVQVAALAAVVKKPVAESATDSTLNEHVSAISEGVYAPEAAAVHGVPVADPLPGTV